MSTISSSSSGAGAARAAKGFGIGSALSLGANIFFPMLTYDDLRKQGKTKSYSAGVAAAEFVGWNVSPMLMTGIMMYEMMPSLIEAGYIIGKQNQDKVRGSYSRNFGGQYVDTQQSYNMREAGMMNINRSKGMVGNALGPGGKSYYTHNLRQSREFTPRGNSKRYYTSQLGAEAKDFYRD